MDKQEVLNELARMASAGEIAQSEVSAIFVAAQPGAAVPQSADEHSLLGHQITMVEILYYFGGLVAFLGVGILMFQNWESIPDIIKIFMTSILGAALLSGGIYLTKSEKLNGVGQAFILAGSLIFPIGIYVILRLSYIDLSLGVQSFVSASLAAIFLYGYWQFRKLLLILFGIAWATACYFFLTSYLFTDNNTFLPNYFEYRVLIAGISYTAGAYYMAMSTASIKKLSGLMYSLGIVALLGAGFALSLESGMWEVIYPLMALGAMLGSVSVKSRAFLIAGAAGLIGYIFQITGKYFAESVGWPVALIIAGFALIGIGYFAVQVNKRYLGKNKTVA